TYACEIPFGDGSDGTFNPDAWMEPKDRRKVDDFILYGMAAADQAVKDAGWEAPSEDEKLRTGVMLGSGIGGLTSIAETAVLIKERGRSGSRRSSSPARSSTSSRGRCRSATVSRGRTMRLSPPARPVPMPSAT